MKKATPTAALAVLLVLSMTACSSSRKADADPAATTVTTTSNAATATVAEPSVAPIAEPSVALAAEPRVAPVAEPSVAPAAEPSVIPTAESSVAAAAESSAAPAAEPSAAPAAEPSVAAVADNASNSGDDKPGAGHVSMTGDAALESDFVVDMCQAGPPGGGLLSGYHMAMKDGDPHIAILSIGLKNYDKDGVYDVPSLSREAAVGQAMSSGMMGPLMLMVVSPGNPTPFAFSQTPSSKLTITVSDNGAKGSAAFTNLESQPDMSKFDLHAGKMPAGKRASGSITWKCGTVGRIDPKMNDAVNSAFKKLIPGS